VDKMYDFHLGPKLPIHGSFQPVWSSPRSFLTQVRLTASGMQTYISHDRIRHGQQKSTISTYSSETTGGLRSRPSFTSQTCSVQKPDVGSPKTTRSSIVEVMLHNLCTTPNDLHIFCSTCNDVVSYLQGPTRENTSHA
jgi:hypothetical protein